MSRLQLFVVVAPGLEQLAAAEFGELGVPSSRIRVRHGGLDVQATVRQLYAAHRWCRIPTRVLLRVATGSARRWDELQDLVRSVGWDHFVRPTDPVELHVASKGSTLYHEGAIAERVLTALNRRTLPEQPNGPRAQAVHVRIDHNRVVLSVDASGDLLHRRGWRVSSHRSPLRTTLAAAMVRASGWDGAVPLIDPMCGSGTIPIEAALTRSGSPIERDFAFLRWPSFEPGTWASVRGASRADLLRAAVVAADRDAGAIASCREHIAATGLDARITVEQAALTTQHWPQQPGVVIVNPPYGRRVGGRDLRDLYASLGRRAADGGHRVALLANDPRLVAATGLELDEAFATTNGGIDVRCHVSI